MTTHVLVTSRGMRCQQREKKIPQEDSQTKGQRLKGEKRGTPGQKERKKEFMDRRDKKMENLSTLPTKQADVGDKKNRKRGGEWPLTEGDQEEGRKGGVRYSSRSLGKSYRTHFDQVSAHS